MKQSNLGQPKRERSDPARDESGRRPPPRTAKTGICDLVVICAKCGKRQGLPKREVGRRLKRALKTADPERKVKVVASGCLGPCPKRLIAVATPASLASGRLILLDPGLAPESVVPLLPDFGRKA